MVAKSKHAQRGQSVIELVFILPFMVGMFVILSRINTAMQVSIVNQQYARAQTLTLAQNSPYYPRRDQQKVMSLKNSNQLIMGVSDRTMDSEDDDERVPYATAQWIARGKPGPDVQDKEPDFTMSVRIRNTVSLCTHSIVVNSDTGFKLYSADTVKEGMTSQMLAYCRNGNFDGGRRP